ncbi:hypothetical protein [Lachnoclostridium phytofermentans]|uniref:Uracil-DNA glycosylase-like domain-containing protein n=1 Tax=Lachnoclostridium phytofermentans (strain ATCC 700394 / DSM 18823 / ISDg) TaxID=357809 RepID=A9KM20_LACP7|nr:hypothetical protein [Lachnoclostridium phytofermentans]ABX41363.1 conserved hypothetical protein [Lachnoclostridium phytofermentans ISDg]
MKKTLIDYKDAIDKLTLKEKYEKQEILTKEFLIEKDGDIEIYYAPHNEYRNIRARIFIIGITPGFQQMSTAIATAKKGLNLKFPIEQIQYECKVAGRFSGVIRKNIIQMLDELELPSLLGINSTSDLFSSKDELLHTVSLIPYSVFLKKQNYSGHTPKLLKSNLLTKYIYENFLEEYNTLKEKEKVLLIPLGRAVEEVLIQLEGEGLISKNQILLGFPHPSGANVNRITQFQDNKLKMMDYLQKRVWS